MKNEYFGDKYDFRKYGLLQFLQGGESVGWNWSILMNWMLTKSETDEGEGRNYAHLQNNAPDIFKKLQPYNKHKKGRKVSHFPQLEILSQETEYYTDCVPDAADATPQKTIAEARKCWFDKFVKISKTTDSDLVFFDPDNGIEVKSTGYNSSNSYKYLYLDEIEEIYRQGKNILIYQHRARQKLEEFISIKKTLLKPFGDPLVFKGESVFFFLLLQNPRLEEKIKAAFKEKHYSEDYLRIL